MRKKAEPAVLVIEPSAYMAQIFRGLLADAGFSRVSWTDNTNSALQLLSGMPIDVVLCDCAAGPLDAGSFVRSLRSGQAGIDPMVPVLLTSFRPVQRLVEEWRDLGVTEVLVKPISARHLSEKITQALTRPRPFVEARAYKGPCRRRRGQTGFSGPDRRTGGRVRMGTAPHGWSHWRPGPSAS
ncbi:MAG: response regulator [Alphaproteobacteria bacterium]|nr:response regulator [Alphaproteobacteria bacterium]